MPPRRRPRGDALPGVRPGERLRGFALREDVARADLEAAERASSSARASAVATARGPSPETQALTAQFAPLLGRELVSSVLQALDGDVPAAWRALDEMAGGGGSAERGGNQEGGVQAGLRGNEDAGPRGDRRRRKSGRTQIVDKRPEDLRGKQGGHGGQDGQSRPSERSSGAPSSSSSALLGSSSSPPSLPSRAGLSFLSLPRVLQMSVLDQVPLRELCRGAATCRAFAVAARVRCGRRSVCQLPATESIAVVRSAVAATFCAATVDAVRPSRVCASPDELAALVRAIGQGERLREAGRGDDEEREEEAETARVAGGGAESAEEEEEEEGEAGGRASGGRAGEARGSRDAWPDAAEESRGQGSGAVGESQSGAPSAIEETWGALSDPRAASFPDMDALALATRAVELESMQRRREESRERLGTGARGGAASTSASTSAHWALPYRALEGERATRSATVVWRWGAGRTTEISELEEARHESEALGVETPPPRAQAVPFDDGSLLGTSGAQPHGDGMSNGSRSVPVTALSASLSRPSSSSARSSERRQGEAVSLGAPAAPFAPLPLSSAAPFSSSSPSRSLAISMVESLALRSPHVYGAALEALSSGGLDGAPALPRLRRLDLSGCSWSGLKPHVRLAAFRALSREFPHLEELSLSATDVTTDLVKRLFEPGAHTSRGLRALDLSACPGADVQAVLGGRPRVQLERLAASRNRAEAITLLLQAASPLREFRADACERLRAVRLSAPRLERVDLRRCRALERLEIRSKTLRELLLDDAASLVTLELPNPPTLATLEISNAPRLADATLFRVAQAGALRGLQTLRVERCDNVASLDWIRGGETEGEQRARETRERRALRARQERDGGIRVVHVASGGIRGYPSAAEADEAADAAVEGERDGASDEENARPEAAASGDDVEASGADGIGVRIASDGNAGGEASAFAVSSGRAEGSEIENGASGPVSQGLPPESPATAAPSAGPSSEAAGNGTQAAPHRVARSPAAARAAAAALARAQAFAGGAESFSSNGTPEGSAPGAAPSNIPAPGATPRAGSGVARSRPHAVGGSESAPFSTTSLPVPSSSSVHGVSAASLIAPLAASASDPHPSPLAAPLARSAPLPAASRTAAFAYHPPLQLRSLTLSHLPLRALDLSDASSLRSLTVLGCPRLEYLTLPETDLEATLDGLPPERIFQRTSWTSND